MLEEISDNIADINGFLAFANEIGASVVLSRDSHCRHNRLTDKAFDMLVYFVEQCKKSSLRFQLALGRFAPDFDRLKDSGVLEVSAVENCDLNE